MRRKRVDILKEIRNRHDKEISYDLLRRNLEALGYEPKRKGSKVSIDIGGREVVIHLNNNFVASGLEGLTVAVGKDSRLDKDEALRELLERPDYHKFRKPYFEEQAVNYSIITLAGILIVLGFFRLREVSSIGSGLVINTRDMLSYDVGIVISIFGLVGLMAYRFFVLDKKKFSG
jgi:hypothetical protein